MNRIDTYARTAPSALPAHSKQPRGRRGRRFAVAVALCATALLAAPPAEAGRGGSFGKIRSAVNNGSPDAIVSELERAENIPCSSDCMALVMDLLSHDSWYVRDGAAWWFARRPAQKAEVTEWAVAMLATGNAVEVRNAADALARVGHPRNLPDLAAALAREGTSDEARAACARAVGSLAHISGADVLKVALADGGPQTKRAAIDAWGRLLRQTNASAVVPLVSDSDTTVRRAAAAMVGKYREAGARSQLESLVVADPDPHVRRNAAWALGRIGDANSKAALTQATTDESSLVRMTAKAALRTLR